MKRPQASSVLDVAWSKAISSDSFYSFPVLDEFGRPWSLSTYVPQGFTMWETIASLNQKLTTDTEEDMTAEDDINMAEAYRETDAEEHDEEPNGNRKGPF